MSLGQKVRRAVREPGAAWVWATSLLRGHWVRLWCRIRGIDFTVGRNFRVVGRIVFRGPGRVVFGDDVIVDRVVTPWTHAPDAVIEVGSRSYLNGTRFGCQQSIVIGERAIISDASIADTDQHSTHVDRHSPTAPVRVRSVEIGDNVWIAGAVGILPGTRIGRNCVVGYGAVCAGTYPAHSIIVGNPARVVKRVPGTEDLPDE